MLVGCAAAGGKILSSFLCPVFLAIPKVRLETIYICGVDEMSTQDVFSYFKEYPPAHIEWLDDTSCKYPQSVLLNMLSYMILKEFLPSQMVNDCGQTMPNLCLQPRREKLPTDENQSPCTLAGLPYHFP